VMTTSWLWKMSCSKKDIQEDLEKPNMAKQN